jgi:IS30 family transposase
MHVVKQKTPLHKSASRQQGYAYLCREISAKLICKLSPQQIAGWVMREHPDDEDKRVSHETIYRSLLIQTRSVLKKELFAHLRATRAIRRSRHATLKRTGIGKFNDAISIRDRPAEVEDRAVTGHWPLGDARITFQLIG